MKKITTLLSVFILSFFTLSFSADESVTITTYYPSPFGSYKELRSTKIAVGDSYVTPDFCWEGGCANPINADADLVVEGNVGIGTTNPRGILDLTSTTTTFLPPRMTNAQRNALISPLVGSLIYNTSNDRLEMLTATGWKASSSGISILTTPVLLGEYTNCTQFSRTSWYTIDVSSHVPSDATAVIVKGTCRENIMSVRAIGSSWPRCTGDSGGNANEMRTCVCWSGNNGSEFAMYIVALDNNLQFQWANRGTDCNSVGAVIYLVGWIT